jgi:NHL repeat
MLLCLHRCAWGMGGAAALVWMALAQTGAQPNSQPNPYRTVEGWFHLPEGRSMGSTSAVDVDPQGHIWVGERCGVNSCAGSTLAPVLEFEPSGRLLKSWGVGMSIFPHGIAIDNEGNIWITDGQGKDGKGHQVFKFSADGKVLMTLGKPGVAGDGPDTFNQPNDVDIAPNGDIFVSDGHTPGMGNVRVVKFSKDGKFLKQWAGTDRVQGNSKCRIL